jgi:G3E family GTPase
MDDEIASYYLLDAVVTLVDAKHGHATLDAQPEAQSQVGFADRILLTKTDLVSNDEVESLRERLLQMNPRAPIKPVKMGEIALQEVLDLRGFNLNAILEIDPQFLAAEHPDATRARAGADDGADDDRHDHHHGDGHEHGHHGHAAHHHHHDDAIKAFVFQSARPFDAAKLEEYMGALTQVYGQDMLRYKGVLFMNGSPRRMILQGVHMLMGADVGRPWGKDERPASKMVFIGRNLPRDAILKGLPAGKKQRGKNDGRKSEGCKASQEDNRQDCKGGQACQARGRQEDCCEAHKKGGEGRGEADPQVGACQVRQSKRQAGGTARRSRCSSGACGAGSRCAATGARSESCADDQSQGRGCRT